MKLFVEFGTEIISLSITSVFDDAQEVVMNYIALGVISELDEVYYSTVKSSLRE